MTVKTVLRYPGGKSKLTGFISELIRTNDLHDATYVEPYAGGGGACINLLLGEFVKNVVMNDLDIHIYSFWKSILNDTESFLKMISEKKITLGEWKKQKRIFLQPRSYSQTKVGFSSFFLNRCNYSGILTGGVIGGQSQLGKYKIDARFNKKELSKKIERIALYSKRIKVLKYDALTLLKKLNVSKKKFFVYLDPPYYNKSDSLYYNIYKDRDHENLSSFLKVNRRFSWILSYDNCKEIRNLYKGHRRTVFSLNYSLSDVRKGQELMIFDRKIKVNKNTLVLL